MPGSHKTVAHCATPYLQLNNGWLYAQLTHLNRYRPIVLTQEHLNPERFSGARVYSAEAYPPLRRFSNRLVRRWCGMYPYYSEILTREHTDLIHAHFGHQGCRCLRAKLKTELPMVTSFYGFDVSRDQNDPKWKKMYHQLFAEGDLFLVEGGAMAQRLVEAGCHPDKVRVHRLGVSLSDIEFQPRAQAYGVISFLICAPFREKKGIPFALRALEQVRASRPLACKLTLVGDGPEREAIVSVLKETSLSEVTTLRGWLSYPDLLEEMASCHLLLQTSVTADDGDTEGGAPVILLDAQASGMPVVASRHADIPEYVVDGKTGYLAPERDVEALADRILELVDHPEVWPTMGKAGRDHVTEHFNATTQSEKLEQIYDELCP